jgi:predicted metal-dependent peptidase
MKEKELDTQIREVSENATTKLAFSKFAVLFEELIILTKFIPVTTEELPTFMAISPTSSAVNIYVNPDLLKMIAKDINAIVTILAHEYCHVLNGHCWTPLPDHFIDNLAADAEINQPRYLAASNINAGQSSDLYGRIKEMVITPEKFDFENDKSREYYYEQFKKKVKTVTIEVEMPSQGQGKSCNESSNKDSGGNKGTKVKVKVKVLDSHDKWKESDVQNARSIYERIVRESLEKAKQQGTVPGSFIEEILAKWEKCKDLEHILRRIITKVYRNALNERVTRLRPSRRNPLLPGTKDDYGPSFIFAVDTSGSMSTRELEKLLSVFRWCCKKFGRTDLIQCDADVHGIMKDFGSKTVVQVKGRGGTDFRPVFDYIHDKCKDKIDLLVYGTDLEGTFPKDTPPYNVVWVVPEGGSPKKVPFGQVIHLGNNNLKKGR